MIRNARPAPLALSPPPRARLDARRGSLRSRHDLFFAQQHQAVPGSAFDWDEEEGRLGRLGTRVRRQARRGLGDQPRALRLALDAAHLLVCVVPVLVVALFLGSAAGAVSSPTG
jgi:hypothetical protein